MATIMKTYLHFTGGDNLLFQSWHPSSSGALAGACIGLALVALVERWLFATRAGLESYWRHKTLASEEKYCDNETARASSRPRKGRTAPPFTATHDILRGVVHAVQALLGYILMLAVMTFQAAYIISIILGLGVGEILFGRMNSSLVH